MFAPLEPQPVQKKNDHAAQAHPGPEAEASAHGHAAPTTHGTGATAAPVMSHWAEAGDHKPRHGQGAHDKKAEDGERKPRMVHDERFSEDSDVVQDGTGRIINISIVGGQSRITIGLGRKQGVRVGMEGYIKKGNGMLADFQIDSTGDRVAHAMVDATPDMIHGHTDVVINPSAMPSSSEPQADMKSRIVGVSIIGGRTQILIGRGTSHGARAGMIGHIVANGKVFEKFEVTEAGSNACKAFVDRTIDGLQGHHDVILNPAG